MADVGTGFEARHIGECSTNVSNPAGVGFDTSIYRTALNGYGGKASLKCSKTGTAAANQTITGYTAATGVPANYSYADAYTSFGARYPAAPSAIVTIAYWKNTGGSVKASLKLDTDRTLKLYDLNSTLLATSSAISLDAFHLIEVRIGTGSAGACAWSFKLDNSTVGSGSSATLSSTNNGNLALGFPGSENVGTSGTPFVGYYDDVTISSTGFVAYDTYYVLSHAAGDSADNTGYTASTGNKYDCVGEGPPPSATNYISASGAAVYTATMQSCSTAGVGPSDIVTAVTVIVAHSKHGSAGSDKLTVRDSGTNTVFATAVTDPATMALLGWCYTTTPTNNSTWTQALANQLEVGATYVSTKSGIDEIYMSIRCTPVSGTQIDGTSSIGFAPTTSLKCKTYVSCPSSIGLSPTANLKCKNYITGTSEIGLIPVGDITDVLPLEYIDGTSDIGFATSASIKCKTPISGASPVSLSPTLSAFIKTSVSASSQISLSPALSAFVKTLISGPSAIGILPTSSLISRVSISGPSTIGFLPVTSLKCKTFIDGPSLIRLITAADILPRVFIGSSSGIGIIPAISNLSIKTLLSGNSTIRLAPTWIREGVILLDGASSIGLSPSLGLFIKTPIAGTSSVSFSPVASNLVLRTLLGGSSGVNVSPILSGLITKTYLSGSSLLDISPRWVFVEQVAIDGTSTIELIPASSLTVRTSIESLSQIELLPTILDLVSEVVITYSSRIGLSPSLSISISTPIYAGAEIGVDSEAWLFITRKITGVSLIALLPEYIKPPRELEWAVSVLYTVWDISDLNSLWSSENSSGNWDLVSSELDFDVELLSSPWIIGEVQS